jgi:streptogramin lyase
MAVGRKTVAPRQTITSQWGNWVWDQSIQSFADKAARTTQFPAPQLGATCVLDDHPGQVYQWDGTQWMTRQSGKATMSTDPNSFIVFTYPKPFTAAPQLFLQGDGTTSFTVLLAPLAGQAYNDRVNIVVRSAGPTNISGLPSTGVGFIWMAYGPD